MKELKSLRIKFVISNMLMVTLVIGLAFLAVGLFTKNSMERRSEQALGEAALMEGNGFLAYPALGGQVRFPYFILITDGQDHVIRVEGQYRLGLEDEFLQYIASDSLLAQEDMGVLEHYQLKYLRRPFENGYKITYVDTSLGESFADGMWNSLAVIGLAVWLALFGVSCLLSKWAVYPVDRSLRREKQFVADASHELKTPLTVILANAQLLASAAAAPAAGQEAAAAQASGQAGTAAQTPALLSPDVRRWLTNISQEAAEMKRLVEEMLALARSEAKEGVRIRETCCLSDLVIESVLSFEAVYYQKDKELDSNVEEDLWVRGDESRLRQLLRILLDNGEKYSPPKGRTRVCLERLNARRLRLTVSNTGPLIPENKRKEIFERFYRSEDSRSSKTGYGLGLAIAKSIVEAHRGKIYVESSGGENHFIVEMKITGSGREKTNG